MDWTITEGELDRDDVRALLAHIGGVLRDPSTRLSLETGSTARFAAAIRLYESEGFARCGPFGGYADTSFTRFFTRAL